MKRHVFRGLFLLAVLVTSWLCIGRFAVAQRNSFDLGGFETPNGAPISTESVIVAAQGDQPAILVVTAIVKNGYKIYSITQPPGGPVQTKIKLDASDQFTIGEFQAKHEKGQAQRLTMVMVLLRFGV